MSKRHHGHSAGRTAGHATGLAARDSKRDRVLGRARRRSWTVTVLGVVVAVLAGVVLTLTVDPLGLLGRDDAPEFKLASRRYDAGQPVTETPVTPELKDGKVYVDLATVDKSNLVRFELAGKEVTLPNGASFDALPVIVYVAPSGRVVAAVSFCEPCAGTSFHISGNRLVCNVCGTQWSLEKLQGLAGGCLTYPPDEVAYSVDGGNLVLSEQQLRDWTPRI